MIDKKVVRGGEGEKYNLGRGRIKNDVIIYKNKIHQTQNSLNTRKKNQKSTFRPKFAASHILTQKQHKVTISML